MQPTLCKREPYYFTFLTVGDLSAGPTDRSCFVGKAGRQKAEGDLSLELRSPHKKYYE